MKENKARGIVRSLSVGMALLLPIVSMAQQKRAAAPTAQAGNAGQPFESVIVHEFESQIQQLMLLSAFEPDSKKIGNQEDAERLFRNTQKAVNDSQDEGPSIAIASNLARDSAALVGYFLANYQSKENQAGLKVAAQWLQKFSVAYGEASKKPIYKQKALYWGALAKYILSDGGEGVSDMIPLREQLASEKEIAANIDLLVGYSLAISPATAQQGFNYMNQAGKDMSVYGKLGQKLTEAYVEYGLDAEGNPIGVARPGADTKITYAIQVARGMPAGIQHLVMNTSIYIWTHAGINKGQKTPGFLTDGFAGVLPVEALREQEALAYLKAQNYKQASTLYRTIANAFGNSDLGAKLDGRIWEIELLNFQKTGGIADLETTFMSLRERYRDKRKPADPDTPTYASIAEAYRKVLDQLLTTALGANASPAMKQTAIQTTMRYVKIEADRQQAYPLKAKVAQLYRSLNMFKEAVDLYLDIAKENPMKNYLLAVESQSRLAAWPTQPYFDKAAAGDAGERTKLLSIFETISQLRNGDDWFMLAHIGLLNRALGQNKKTEDLWMKALKTNMNSKLAMEAGGLLLAEFYAGKRWEDVIDLAHLFIAKKAVPTSKGRNMNYQPWLADALYNGGLADLQAQNFPRSVKHLEEFVQGFANDPRIAAATYSLAYGYKGTGKLVAALNACKIVVEKYLRYSLRPKVMLQAAEWGAADRNTWEYSFFFYTRYLTDYKNERNVPEIRMTLADLYLKRKLYGWAARLYKEQSLASNVTRAQQLAAAVKYMDIEEQYGEPKDAYAGAIRITQLAGPKDPAAMHALAFMGRYVANNKDLKGMAEIEPKLLNFSKASKEVQEAVGFVRFRRAEMMTRPIVYTENNLLIKDPEAVVKKYFDVFENEKQHYLKVCQIGITVFCAPAMLRLTVVARQGMEAIDKVTIAETLGPNRVNSFKVFKQLHLSKVQQARKDFIDQALKLARAGTTTPIWKDEVIKTLEYEGKSGVAH
ncbi:tetratricopeptide repeat protein [Oligoflexus tunisiensis]|uniref:tetratricopeptide repeat protein n=1 Tax=Oligoflexus tunisiensis TaxID=708132 RepID=UPI00114D2ED5|nr:hypothetical protein [Oligoflexus tunisiensis]